jgi:hypothetical protein
MQNIKLTDALGLGLDGKLAPGATLRTLVPAFAKLTGLPLDQVPATEAAGVLNGSQPIDLGGGIALQFGGSGGGRFALLGPKAHSIDEDDPFTEIPIAENEIYVALALTFSLSAGVNGTFGPATLGFSGEQEFEIRCYRRFRRGPAGFPAFGAAFAATANAFRLPTTAGELEAIDADTVLVLRSTGSVTVSAGVSVSMPVQSLASVSLPGNIKLEAKAGAEVAIHAGVTVSGGYQVRLRHTDGRNTELGIYKMKSREANFSVSAQAGVTASAGGFELTQRVIGALSTQPVVDREEFQKALPGEDSEAKTRRIEGFEAGLKAAVSAKLQISVAAAWSNLSSHEAAWLFEIDPVTGVREISNILTDTGVHKLTVKINLLGLANAISVSKLVQVTTTEHNGKGEVTLVTDSSTSSRLQALLVTFGGDGKRLRKLLSEDFLISATYSASDVGVLPASFKARHRYLEIHDSTSRDEMKNHLDAIRALGLLTAEKAGAILSANKSFDRISFYAETAYTSDAVRAAFLQAEDYESIGRAALGALLQGDRGQEFRLRVATDDALWAQLKDTQNRAAFPPLFGLHAGAVDPRVEAAGADFLAIQGWARAMAAAGQATREVDALFSEGTVAVDDPRFTKAREILKERLGDVVKNTREEFGDPLGMVMFYEAAKRNADRKAVLSGPKIETLELSAGAGLIAHA